MRRLICWFLGHGWDIHANSYRSIVLVACSSVVGSCATCKRCGKKYCDIPSSSVDKNGDAHVCNHG